MHHASARSLLTLLFIVYPTLSYSELLPNPGFERWKDNLPVGWELYRADAISYLTCGPADSGAHGGKKCLKLSDAWAGAGELTGVRTAREITLAAGKRYLFSFWYKNNAGAYPWTNAVTIEFRGAEKHQSLYFQRSPAARMNWKQFRCLLPPVPEGHQRVQVRIGLAGGTRDMLMIDDVSLRLATAAEVEKLFSPGRARVGAIPEFRPEPNGEATGFIHTEYLQGAWWLVGPEGQRFWSIGCASSYPGKSNRKLARKAGGKGKYRRKIIASLRDRGFNSLAAGSDVEFLKLNRKMAKKGGEVLPFFINLELSRAAGKDAMLRNMRAEIRLPPMVDPHHPRWREAARKKITETAKRCRNDAWFGGYLVDQRLIGLSRLPFYLWGEYSGAYFVAWLKDMYADDIGRLNEKWCTPDGRRPYASFEELAERKAEPLGLGDPALRDFQAFAGLLYREYVDFAIATIREADPNHLVISHLISPEQVIALGPYFETLNMFDVVAVSVSPKGTVKGFDGGELSVILRLHQGCRKPLLVTNLSLAALDSGLYAPPYTTADPVLSALPTQQDRADVYRGCLTQMASLPYVLGTHWYHWHDIEMDVMHINCGLVNSRDEPYTVLTNTMREIHAEIFEKKGLLKQ